MKQHSFCCPRRDGWSDGAFYLECEACEALFRRHVSRALELNASLDLKDERDRGVLVTRLMETLRDE